MRCLGALALLLVGLIFPVSAQRGSVRAGGSFGHMTAPAAAGLRGGFGSRPGMAIGGRAGMAFARPAFTARPRVYSSRGFSYAPARRDPRFLSPRYGAGLDRPFSPYLGRPVNTHRDRPISYPRRPYPGRGGRGYGYPVLWTSGFPYPGFFDLGFLDPLWDDEGGYGDTQAPFYGSAPVAPDAYAAADGYAPADGSSPDAYPQYPDGNPDEASDAHGPLVYAPNMYGPDGDDAAPTPREENAVTLIFLDGRPPEQIRNYALTRTSVLVMGDPMREIPVQELNLPLTEQVNRASGVDFRLPGTN